MTTLLAHPESVLPRNCVAVETWKSLGSDQIVWAYVGDSWQHVRVLRAGRSGVRVTLDLTGAIQRPHTFVVATDFILVPRG